MMQPVVLALLVLVIAAASPAYGRPLAFDLQRSKMTVYVNKQGAFAFLADNHQVDAPIASGSYDAETKSIEFTVDATKMRVLDPKLPQQKRDEVQTNMLGTGVLDVAEHPQISFHSTSIDDTNPRSWTVTGSLALRGQTHPIAVRVVRTDATHFSGSATIRQTAFGITPIKIAGGSISVKDDINVQFSIALKP